MATIRLTDRQRELLTDIATKPRMYLRTYSLWGRTGQSLARLGLATLRDIEGGQTEITITAAGRGEAARRGLVATGQETR